MVGRPANDALRPESTVTHGDAEASRGPPRRRGSRADAEADWTIARHQLAGLAVGREQGAGSGEQYNTNPKRERGPMAISSPSPVHGRGAGGEGDQLPSPRAACSHGRR